MLSSHFGASDAGYITPPDEGVGMNLNAMTVHGVTP